MRTIERHAAPHPDHKGFSMYRDLIRIEEGGPWIEYDVSSDPLHIYYNAVEVPLEYGWYLFVHMAAFGERP